LSEVWWGNIVAGVSSIVGPIVAIYCCKQVYSRCKNRHERRMMKSLLREYSMNPEISDPYNPFPAEPFEEKYPLRL
jgi:hypothetical protein